MVRSASRKLIWNMSPSLITEHRPLPFAPRPFDAEVLGGWLGRIAARYRMSVQAFAAACELDFHGSDAEGWLLLPRLPARTIERLAALTRISVQQIKNIPVPPPWKRPRKHFCYCARCVFLNPLDVAAPIWRREWLDQTLRPSRVVSCENLDNLLALVSRHERSQRYGALPWRASRFIERLAHFVDLASGFN
jgi:hypothetical protein